MIQQMSLFGQGCGLGCGLGVKFSRLPRHGALAAGNCQCIGHRRKQFGAALRKAPAPLGRDDATLAALFAAAGIEPAARAEQLTNGQWQALARAFTEGQEGSMT